MTDYETLKILRDYILSQVKKLYSKGNNQKLIALIEVLLTPDEDIPYREIKVISRFNEPIGNQVHFQNITQVDKLPLEIFGGDDNESDFYDEEIKFKIRNILVDKEGKYGLQREQGEHGPM